MPTNRRRGLAGSAWPAVMAATRIEVISPTLANALNCTTGTVSGWGRLAPGG
jgi:hypothetical protein